MEPRTNKQLHAIAGSIAPGNAHALLKQIALERFGLRSLSDVTELQAREISSDLRATKERMRQQVHKALTNAESELISEEQIGYVWQLINLLGWSDNYLATMINNRYQESSLELMPKWKALRLIAILQKRWHSKKNESIDGGGEMSDMGYVHYQRRLSLVSRVRPMPKRPEGEKIIVTRMMTTNNSHQSIEGGLIKKGEIGIYEGRYDSYFFTERCGCKPFVTREFVEKNLGDLFSEVPE